LCEVKSLVDAQVIFGLRTCRLQEMNEAKSKPTFVPNASVSKSKRSEGFPLELFVNSFKFLVKVKSLQFSWGPVSLDSKTQFIWTMSEAKEKFFYKTQNIR
jgi:hypothetical protein